MNAILGWTLLGSLLFVVGCVSTPKNTCRAAISHSPTEYDVCIGEMQARPGDRVVFFKDHCPSSSGRSSSSKKCHKEKVGEGVVLKTLDEHLSRVQLDTAFEINESMAIEKKQ